LEKKKLSNRAVILGAAGFIGINLSHTLAAQGWEVICFDHITSPNWPLSAKIIVGDFEKMPAALLESMEDATVFHLISSCRPSATTEKAADEVAYDLISTINYLELCRDRALRWVFISSGGTVYGHTEENALLESAGTQPICTYGLVKLSIEQYFSLYKKIHNIDYVVVRLANPYGPWQRPLIGQGLVATLIYKALNGESIEVWGSGENVRDYIYIDDAIEGILAAAQNGQSGEIYNVGTGKGTSINELIGMMREALSLEITFNYAEARNVDVKRNVLDNKKLSRRTGWKPVVNFDVGVQRSADWIKTKFKQ
jgi:UDP-glucose 4-epimerase